MSVPTPASSRSARRPSWLSPTPPSVAIEIASRRVTVAEIARGESVVVSACASEALPDGAVRPALVGVNIVSPAHVTDALRRALQRAGLIGARRAAFIVPDSIARVSLLNLEQVPAKPHELDQLIRWQLRKSTPFPLEEARVDHLLASRSDTATTLAAVVVRRDVLEQYETVAQQVGIHAGIVDLASFNVINAVIGGGSAPAGDWLLVCLAPEGTTIAILRGEELMFYRHRAAIEEEPLSALVHQTAMYHEDRLAGSSFSRVYLCGAATADAAANRARAEITDRLGVVAENVDIRSAAAFRDRIAPGPDTLDALAAPIGLLLRERVA